MASSSDMGHLTLIKASSEGIQQCRLRVGGDKNAETLEDLSQMLQHMNTTTRSQQSISNSIHPTITDSLPKSRTPTPVTTDHTILPNSAWDDYTSLLLISDEYVTFQGSDKKLHPALALDPCGRDLWSKRLVALCGREISTELTADEEEFIKAYEPTPLRYTTCARQWSCETTPGYPQQVALRAFEELEKDSQALKERLTASHGDRVTFGCLSTTQKDDKTEEMDPIAKELFARLDGGMSRVDVSDSFEEERHKFRAGA